MPSTRLPVQNRETQVNEQQTKKTLAALFDNLRNNLGASEKQFNDASKTLEDFLRSPRTKVIFYGTKFIDEFMRKELMPLASAAHKINKDLYSMIARVSKEYEIMAGEVTYR